MTSVQSQSPCVTMEPVYRDDVGDESDVESHTSREGIFEKFAEDLDGQALYYYTVQSSSDSEGNITLHDVKRETFGDDVKVVSEMSDESDDVTEPVRSARYTLRTRRSRKRRDDEFMMMCGDSTDDMASDDNAARCELSSDDETYDVVADNWTYVRCGKKKTPACEGGRAGNKKNNSPKKTANKESVSKTNKLKIKLRSAFTRKKKNEKPKKTLKTRPQKYIEKAKPLRQTTMLKKSLLKSAKTSRSSSVTSSPAKKSANATASGIASSVSSMTSLQNSTLNKKRFRRRCGYNPTAPKVSEIRHVRRRLLKQNPKRVKKKSESETSNGDDLSESSSDDEEGGGASGDNESATPGARSVSSNVSKPSKTKVTQAKTPTKSQSGWASKTDPSIQLPKKSTAPPSGNDLRVTSSDDRMSSKTGMRGIKIVIRRESLESIEQAQADVKLIQNKHILATQTVKVKPTTTATSSDAGKESKAEVEKNNEAPISQETEKKLDNAEDVKGDSSSIVASESVVDATNVIAESCDVTNKQSQNEESPKKKKLKKKKKRDRGRLNSSAAAEDSFDAEETDNRLAMELPRHNWLVKHLIKENKLKAEDAKPVNTLGADEQKQTEEASKAESKPELNAQTAQKDSKQEGSKETEISISSTNLECKAVTDDKVEVKGDIAKDQVRAPRLKNTKDASPDSEIFKTPNNVKGSSMVGIVKPFQHLKMFPATAPNEGRGNGDRRDSYNDQVMSPPALCIVDEEDLPSSQAEDKKTNKTPGRNKTDLGNGEAVSNPNLTASNSGRVTSDPLGLTYNTESQLSNATIDSASNNDKATNLALAADDKDETHSDIKILKCDSIALDLTKKATHKPTDPDQPLDLSLGPKPGKKFPKILDLSIKKSAEQESPKKSQSTSSINSTLSAGVSDLTTKCEAARDLDVIVIEDCDETSKKIKDASKHDAITDVKDEEKIPECFIKFPNTKPEEKPASVSYEKKTTIRQHPKKRPFAEEKLLKRHVSAPGVPNGENLGPSAAKRHQSLDSVGESMHPEVLGKINPMSLLQTLATKTYMDMKDGTTVSAVKRMCDQATNTASAPKKIKLGDPEDNLQILNVVQTQTSMPNRQTTMLFQNENMIPIPQEQNLTMKPGLASNISPGINVNLPKLAPKPRGFGNISDQVSRFQVSSPGKNPKIPAHLPPVPPSKKITPEAQLNVQQTSVIPPQYAISYGGAVERKHVPNFRPEPPRLQSSVINCGPRNQMSTPGHFSLYGRMPMDVNNNNIVSSVPTNLQPLGHEGKTIPNVVQRAPVPRAIDQERHLVTQDTMRQMVRASPAGAVVDRIAVGQHLNHSINLPVSSPQRRSMSVLATSHNGSFGQQDVTDLRPIVQQQQRVLDEKIQQLEALKRQLNIQQSLQTQIKHPIHQPVLAGSYHVPNIHLRAPLHQQLPQNRTQTPGFHQQVPSSHSPALHHQIPAMSPITHAQLPPYRRIPPIQSQPPIYRNGGLTINKNEVIKTKLNEPIIIEDDVTPSTQSMIAKNRHSYSFHPPLSKNRGSAPPSVPKPTMMSQKHPVQYSFSAASQQRTLNTQRQAQVKSIPDAPIEVCIVCRSKAFFLCSGCKNMWYCSRDCQFKDWSTHSKKCSG